MEQAWPPSDLTHQVDTIKSISRRVLRSGTKNKHSIQKAKTALSLPIEYMRWAEFSSIDQLIQLEQGEKILDIGSPQWYSLVMASLHPNNQFVYTNILAHEIEPFSEIAKQCDINNITYKVEDVKKLLASDCTFDKVLSISVIEHIYPEVGGDSDALNQIKRVLKPNGKIYLTLPYKEKHNIVYRNGPVYERDDNGKNFFAREYDKQTLAVLLNTVGLKENKALFIYEKRGGGALDYYSYGPGRSSFLGNKRKKLVKMIDYTFKSSLTKKLATRYLRISDSPSYRLVNIALELNLAI